LFGRIDDACKKVYTVKNKTLPPLEVEGEFMHKFLSRRGFVIIGACVLLLPLFLVTYLFFLYPEDISFAQTENRFVFGATYMTLNNPYYQVLDTQLRAAIEANGDILLTRDAAMDSIRQKEEIQELIASGVDAIFFTAVEWDASKESLEIAKEANIPVIVVDAPVQHTELVACSVLSDNYQAGVLCAEHLLSVRECAKIILLEHITAHSGTERIQGFVDTLAGHDGFEILASGESDGQIENAMPVMEELLRQAPDADTVMALNDPSAFGALAAIQGAGLSDRFLVYGVDGSPEAKTLIRDHLMTATCCQFPHRVAEEAVRQAYLAIQGMCEQHEIILPVELVTAENVSRYGIDRWQ